MTFELWWELLLAGEADTQEIELQKTIARIAWGASTKVEREACAMAAEALDCRGPIHGAHPDYLQGKRMAASQISAAIRAR